MWSQPRLLSHSHCVIHISLCFFQTKFLLFFKFPTTDHIPPQQNAKAKIHCVCSFRKFGTDLRTAENSLAAKLTFKLYLECPFPWPVSRTEHLDISKSSDRCHGSERHLRCQTVQPFLKKKY